MRYFLVCLLLQLGLYAHVLKITEVVPFGVSNLRISFNQDIKRSVFKEIALNRFKALLQIHAKLMPAPRNYHFANQTSIKITSGKLVKVWINIHKNMAYRLKLTHNHLYIFLEEFLIAQSKPPFKNPPLKKTKRFKVVIDPGHGGHDCGAMGVNGVCEKRIVLAVAKYLQQELQNRAYQVYMTRNQDTYVDLKTRTEFANNKNADLFISIHANSIPKHSNTNPQGVETYFLSTARSERARKVAEQENQDDVKVMDYFSKLSFLNSLNSQRLIISNKLAIDIQFGILNRLRQRYKDVVDGGVREGPFWVLAGALMPSVLIEIGYNSNPKESKRIQDKRYQQALARGIADGVQSFISKNY
ncbi:N-acetylmuramoyl-L-alanine amidase family protein [Helicobacter suis]|uniref:N-acetylmuramoyl-L-alanine amidase family protein n=1 Tax=Helicobacter suis TaxID=104628 RepID=UPI001F080319|nr:N-acetylmuramoyl-L-alanine amidase [Helicobacter suis]